MNILSECELQNETLVETNEPNVLRLSEKRQNYDDFMRLYVSNITTNETQIPAEEEQSPHQGHFIKLVGFNTKRDKWARNEEAGIADKI